MYEIWEMFPLLKKEILGDGNFGADYVRITFRCGSIFDVVSPLNSQRGGRRVAGIIDEFRDHEADDINDVVLPLLNVSRKMKNGAVNPNEPHQVQIWISSASERNTFCYDKTIELMEQAIINPKKTFIMGCDYRLPVFCGLLPKDFLNEIKTSPTFSEASFSKEYLSRFTGSSDEAWFDFEKLLSCRRIVNPETHQNLVVNQDCYYILGVDIARLGCQTICVVLKVYPNINGFRCNLVNIFVLGKTEEEKVFDKQVLELKRIMKAFKPKEVVIDINGVGAPFGDLMIKETYDPLTNEVLPAYAFNNREEYYGIQPYYADKILYGIKANATLNSEMHSALYSRIYSGLMGMLISEQEAKTKLMATKVGQKMKIEKRMERLLPHELTSILIDEIMNLKIKLTGTNNQIAVEQLNTRTGKDKFSALEMANYRVWELEKEFMSRRKNRNLTGGRSTRQLTFFKSGGKRK